MSRHKYPFVLNVLAALAVFAIAYTLYQATALRYDVVIRGGTIYDGSGGAPRVGDVAISADTIAAIGRFEGRGALEIDAEGLAVAPGFINMLSWATESLIVDGRSQSDLRQGVTLEIFGEGWSMGPLNEAMRASQLNELIDWVGSEGEVARLLGQPEDAVPELPWTTLGEYLSFLERKGVAPNVASFVGATTVRIHEIGHAFRSATPLELDRMRALVRQAMEEGALGVGSSLIYAPAFYADTAELIALADVAAEYGGMYISHIRSEGWQLVEAVDELIAIARASGAAAEIYHLKASGRTHWHKLDTVIARVEAARAEGLQVTADVYPYIASSTGLNAAMPLWVQEGGFGAWRARMMDAGVADRLEAEMMVGSDTSESRLVLAGPENVMLVDFRTDSLRHYIGMRLSEIAARRGVTPARAAIDLVVADSSRVGAVYFMMSEDNVRKKLALPWISIDSDAASIAPEGMFLRSNPHPRAYGAFARVLGKYTRDEGVLTLQEAIRRLTLLPATNLKLDRRGALQVGYFADLAIFDPVTIQDNATFEEPHQLATGMIHVFVNGTPALLDGALTGALPGRFVRGPGARQ